MLVVFVVPAVEPVGIVFDGVFVAEAAGVAGAAGDAATVEAVPVELAGRDGCSHAACTGTLASLSGVQAGNMAITGNMAINDHDMNHDNGNDTIPAMSCEIRREICTAFPR